MSTDALATIEDLLGRFNGQARDGIIRAVNDDPAGCLALAWRIRKRTNVSNPAGIFITAIAAGEHRTTPTSTKREAERVERRTPAERARGLYDVKLAELDRVRPDWPATTRHEFALDYALDYCGSTLVRPSEVVAGVQLQADDEEDIPW